MWFGEGLECAHQQCDASSADWYLSQEAPTISFSLQAMAHTAVKQQGAAAAYSAIRPLLPQAALLHRQMVLL